MPHARQCNDARLLRMPAAKQSDKMTDKIVTFPTDRKSQTVPTPKRRAPISAGEIETIGFITTTDRDLWINNPTDIMKVMKFIIQEKIQIFEDKE